MRPSRTLIFQLGQPKLARHVRVPFVVSALPVRWLPIPFRAGVREFGAAASTGGAQTPSSQTQIALRRPTALGWPAAPLAPVATGPTAFPTPNHYRLRDRDAIYGADFTRRVEGLGLEQKLIALALLGKIPWSKGSLARFAANVWTT